MQQCASYGVVCTLYDRVEVWCGMHAVSTGSSTVCTSNNPQEEYALLYAICSMSTSIDRYGQ